RATVAAMHAASGARSKRKQRRFSRFRGGPRLAIRPGVIGQTEGGMTMRALVTSLCASALAVGCAASYPAPTQHMADAEAATRSASEIGANVDPQAQLHLKLA